MSLRYNYCTAGKKNSINHNLTSIFYFQLYIQWIHKYHSKLIFIYFLKGKLQPRSLTFAFFAGFTPIFSLCHHKFQILEKFEEAVQNDRKHQFHCHLNLKNGKKKKQIWTNLNMGIFIQFHFSLLKIHKSVIILSLLHSLLRCKPKHSSSTSRSEIPKNP